MDSNEISNWEKENKDNIIGWEVNYGFEDSNKNWIWYEGYHIIVFKMKDKTKNEFVRKTVP